MRRSGPLGPTVSEFSWLSTGMPASVVVVLGWVVILVPPWGWERTDFRARWPSGAKRFSGWTGRHACHLLLADGRGLVKEPEPDIDAGGDQAAHDGGNDEHPQLAEGGAAHEDGRPNGAGGVDAGAAEPDPGEVDGQQSEADRKAAGGGVGIRLLGDREHDEDEHEREHRLGGEGAPGGQGAVGVLAEAACEGPAGFAARDEVEEPRGEDGPADLRDDVGHEVAHRVTAGCDEPDGH